MSPVLILFLYIVYCLTCITSGIRALFYIRVFDDMATMKFNLPLLDYNTRYFLWQVKMRAIFEAPDLDEALNGFKEKDQKIWTAKEKRKDHKALSLVHLRRSNNILQEVMPKKIMVALWVKLDLICTSKDLTSKIHV